jgi:O-antigen/teichoic acid export membrane protein
MNPAPSTEPDAQAPARPVAPATQAPLGSHAARGFFFMSAQSLATRVVVFAAQLLLAKLLLPEDFGVFGIATAVVAFVSVLQAIGVREILIARQKRFEAWASIGVWISLAVAGLSALGIAAAAPVAARIYGNDDLLGLLLVLAIAQPLYGVTIVQEAKLQIDLRFRALALVNFVQGVLTPTLMVAMALGGAGVYAFVVPRLVAGVVRCAMLVRLAPVPFRRSPQGRYWKWMIAPGVIVLLTALVNSVAGNGPSLILGKISGEEQAGYFFFAFNLTLQGVMLLAATLDQVMFPTLGKLADEPERQRRAFLRALRTLAAAMIFICVAQALAIGPLLHLLIGEKWDGAVTIAQVLSVGMIYLATFIPASSLIQAQGRFSTRLWIGVLWAALFVAGAVPAAYAAQGLGVAVVLGFVYFLSGLHLVWSALRPLGGGVGAFLRDAAPLHVVGLLAGGAGYATLGGLPTGSTTLEVVRVIVPALVFSVLFVAGLRVLARPTFADLVGTARPLAARLARRAG